jgi:hypothetical protein
MQVKAVAQEYRDVLLFFHVDYIEDNAGVINLLAINEGSIQSELSVQIF